MNYIKKLYSGRISRGNYALGLLFFWVLFILFVAVLSGVLAFDDSTLIVIVVLIVYAIFIVYIFSLHVRRLHDVGYSGWWSIPPLTPYVMIALLFMKSRGANKYGDPLAKDIKFFDAIFNRNSMAVIITEKNEGKKNQYCSKCGAKTEEDSRFCFKCGVKM